MNSSVVELWVYPLSLIFSVVVVFIEVQYIYFSVGFVCLFSSCAIPMNACHLPC